MPTEPHQGRPPPRVGGELYERHLTIMLFVAVTAIVLFPVPIEWTIAIAVFALGIYVAFQLRNPSIDIRSAMAGALAKTDPLTGLANRRAMIEMLERCWQQEATRDKGDGLLLCDVDYFKLINDTLAHSEGDRCLREIAAIIKTSLRDDRDHAARFDGEEFLVFLSGCEEHEVKLIAETIRSGVEVAALPNPSSPIGGLVNIGAGIASLTHGSSGKSFEVIQKEANEALYGAKKAGRNRVVVQNSDSPGDGL